MQTNNGDTSDGDRNASAQSVRRLSTGEFNTALVHLYRAEVGKAVRWRSRLDTTTNWSVITTAAAITFAFGSREAERHVVILLISILVTFFLLLETRRYRYYDVWQTRVRRLERDFYAPLLDPEAWLPEPAWQKSFAADLVRPDYHISFMEALGWRLRHNYVWIYLAHLLTWLIKIAAHPTPIASLDHLFSRAAVGPIPGLAMIGIGVVFNGMLILLALTTTRHRRASGEIPPY